MLLSQLKREQNIYWNNDIEWRRADIKSIVKNLKLIKLVMYRGSNNIRKMQKLVLRHKYHAVQIMFMRLL